MVVAQSSMPSAVYNYMFAERYGTDAAEIAGLVVLSTLVSFAARVRVAGSQIPVLANFTRIFVALTPR